MQKKNDDDFEGLLCKKNIMKAKGWQFDLDKYAKVHI